MTLTDMKNKILNEEWESSRDAVPEWRHQTTIYKADGGQCTRVAAVFDEDATKLIKAAPGLAKSLLELVIRLKHQHQSDDMREVFIRACETLYAAGIDYMSCNLDDFPSKESPR